MTIHAFPKGFIWGVATAAQQIEGGFGEDGRSESIWDRFAATPGRIADGSDTRVACDHYHRWRADVELLRRLGVGAYRFSIAWPRIIPEGCGSANTAGLDFYEALVDALLEGSIEPFVTLYHWDLPQALQEKGGWSARNTVERFVEYADAVTKRLGNRVRRWATHNEPWCIAVLGHEEGAQAPGHTDPAEALRVAHHVMLSHGQAAAVIRRNAPGAEVGIVNVHLPVFPASQSAADIDAARRLDGSFNRWFLDPIFHGRYPEDVIADRVRRGHLKGQELPFVQAGDMAAISSPLDFLGVNYYSREVVRADGNGEPCSIKPVPEIELTEMGWEVFPQGIHDTLVRISKEYGPKNIYVTENGAAFDDVVGKDGRINDARRIEFLRDHIAAAHRALADGVPLRGYFVWSFMDNFEWAHGYKKRFGLYRVDFATQRRMAKESAFWYCDVIASNSVDDGK